VAAAGCYVTAAALPLAPLLRAGLIAPTGIIVDAASGVSGAGRALKDSSHFGTVDENFNAYGLLTHRHTPEIEQAVGAQVLFTPHLAPMTRGILATCYARPTSSTSTSARGGSWGWAPSTAASRARQARPCSAPTSCWACPRRPASPRRGSGRDR